MLYVYGDNPGDKGKPLMPEGEEITTGEKALS